MRRVPPHFADRLSSAMTRRGQSVTSVTDAWRVCDGSGDGVPGVYVDRYGPAAILSVYEDAGWSDDATSGAAAEVLNQLSPHGITAVYVKPFAKDRSRLGGKPPAETMSPVPRAGRAVDEHLVVHEYGVSFEVRPYDGFSTGLFLEHREHRRALSERRPQRVLNLFAYTCAFSVALAKAGAHVTNVDVSARYLEWGKRNHALNAIPDDRVRYSRMDAWSYLAYAGRHEHERFDLIVIDPPTFGAGNPRKGVTAWKAATDYPALLQAAAQVLSPSGVIFAASNTRALAEGDTLKELIRHTFGRVRRYDVPPWPADVREQGRVAAALFSPRGASV